jgi:hypothetical protein
LCGYFDDGGPATAFAPGNAVPAPDGRHLQLQKQGLRGRKWRRRISSAGRRNMRFHDETDTKLTKRRRAAPIHGDAALRWIKALAT